MEPCGRTPKMAPSKAALAPGGEIFALRAAFDEEPILVNGDGSFSPKPCKESHVYFVDPQLATKLS